MHRKHRRSATPTSGEDALSVLTQIWFELQSQLMAVDCEGLQGNTKSAGQRRFDVATLAMLTGQRVKMKIFDNVKINGYCYADRVELQPAAE